MLESCNISTCPCVGWLHVLLVGPQEFPKRQESYTSMLLSEHSFQIVLYTVVFHITVKYTVKCTDLCWVLLVEGRAVWCVCAVEAAARIAPHP